MRLGVAALLVALAASACGPDETILEVDGSAVGADRIELVIAGDTCQPTSGSGSACTVTGPNGAAATPVFLRDGLARTQDATANGIARFQLERDPSRPKDVTIGKLVAIGWKGDQPAGFALVEKLALNKPGIYQVALAASSQTRGLAVWTNDMTQPTTAQFACVTAAASDSTTVTIVPVEDPDCDGFTGTEECPGGDFVYHYKQPVSLADMTQANCAVDVPVSTNISAGTACRLGGTGCTDGMTDVPPDAACQPSKFCVPEAVCASCPTLDLACLRDHALDDTGGPSSTPDGLLICPITVDSTFTACSATIGSPVLHVPLSDLLQSAQCHDVSFAALEPTAGANDFHFGQDLEWDPPVNGTTSRPKLQHMTTTNCDVDFQITETAEVTDVAGVVTLHALARYAMTNGYVVIVPMNITITQSGPAGCIDGGMDPSCGIDHIQSNPPHGLAACMLPNAAP